MEPHFSPNSQSLLSKNTHPATTAASSDSEDVFDVDKLELVELYRSIPPPELRSHALSLARDRIVGNVVRKVKDDGTFDNFRKTWLKDLETKPQFQNLIRRVEIRCAEFLGNIKWTPDINKASIRERLQTFVEGLSFVDIGIRDLLQEVHTGIYANPIPFQRFDDSVTRIVSEMVQKYLQGSTPQFPRLRRSDSDPLDDAPVPLPAETTSTCLSSSLEEQAALIRRRTSLSKSPSIETIDMEISSPESLLGNETERPKSSAKEPRRISAEDHNAKPEVLVESNDDLQGALGLLMLASGNAQDWGSYGEESPGQTTEAPEMSEDLPETPEATPVSQTEVQLDEVPVPVYSTNEVSDESKEKKDAILEEPPSLEPEVSGSVFLAAMTEEPEVDVTDGPKNEETVSESTADSIDAAADVVDHFRSEEPDSGASVEPPEMGVFEEASQPSILDGLGKDDTERLPVEAEVISGISKEEPEQIDAVLTSAPDSSVRPTRHRKSNSKYCNDAFVTVPPLPKRGTKRSRGGNLYDEAVSSPASSGGQGELALGPEGRSGVVKKKKISAKNS